MEFMNENVHALTDRMNVKNKAVLRPTLKKTALADVRNTIHAKNIIERDTPQKQFLSCNDLDRDLRSPSPGLKKHVTFKTVEASLEETMPDSYFTSCRCCSGLKDNEECDFLFDDRFRLTEDHINNFATNFIGKGEEINDDILNVTPVDINNLGLHDFADLDLSIGSVYNEFESHLKPVLFEDIDLDVTPPSCDDDLFFNGIVASK